MKKGGTRAPAAAIASLPVANSDTKSLWDHAKNGDDDTAAIDCVQEDHRWIRIIPVMILLQLASSNIHVPCGRHFILLMSTTSL